MSTKCRTCDKVCSYRTEDYVPEYAALLARHNALVEYEAELLGKLGAMEAEKLKHDALVEAVAWERECIDFVNIFYMENDEIRHWVLTTCRAARAEVDRLIATDDCKGEG